MKKIVVIVFLATLSLAYSTTSAMPPPPKVYIGPVEARFVRTKRLLTWGSIIALYGPGFARGRANLEPKDSGIFPRFFCIPSPCYPPKKPDNPK